MRNLYDLGFGGNDHNYKFFETSVKDNWPKTTENKPIEIWFEIESEMLVHARTVYTFYDLLGDVGGLSSTLWMISAYVVSISNALFGSGLSKFLTAEIFKITREETIKPNDIRHEQ